MLDKGGTLEDFHENNIMFKSEIYVLDNMNVHMNRNHVFTKVFIWQSHAYVMLQVLSDLRMLMTHNILYVKTHEIKYIKE